MEPSFEGLPSKILCANILRTLPSHCTSASTVAITHVCQPLYQEFDARMANVHVLPEACGKHRDINGKRFSLRSVNNLQTFRLNAPGESEEV